MATNAPPKGPPNVVIEYENADLTPVYVEEAQGIRTQRGACQISFYSQYLKPLSEVQSKLNVGERAAGSTAVTMELGHADPFGLDTESITIVRRVEANLILTAPVLQSIIPWLQKMLDELIQGSPTNAPTSNNL